MEMNLTHTIHHVLILKCDKTEATMTFRLLIHQHNSLLHLTELIEIGFHLFRASVLTDTTDEDFLGFVGLFWSIFGGGVFWVDLLAVQCVNWHLEHIVNARWVRECDEAETSASL